MFKLERNHTPVCPRESTEQSLLGKVEGTSRSYPTGSASWLQASQVMYYADQITTPRIIVEQSIEWNSPLYVNFVDYEKAFDSLDRESLWKLLRHYGVPMKVDNLIPNSYEGLSCRMVYKERSTEKFEVKTGVRQGCPLSPFLFILAIDWITGAVTNRKRNGSSGHCGRSWTTWNLWKI